MKIKVRWTYAYMKEHTFEEIVEVPDQLDGEDIDPDEARELARDAAMMVPNGDLIPVATSYPGDPVDDIELIVVADPATLATVRCTGAEDEDPTIVEPADSEYALVLRAVDIAKSTQDPIELASSLAAWLVRAQRHLDRHQNLWQTA